jgi:hypothetical protein
MGAWGVGGRWGRARLVLYTPRPRLVLYTPRLVYIPRAQLRGIDSRMGYLFLG